MAFLRSEKTPISSNYDPITTLELRDPGALASLANSNGFVGGLLFAFIDENDDLALNFTVQGNISEPVLAMSQSSCPPLGLFVLTTPPNWMWKLQAALSPGAEVARYGYNLIPFNNDGEDPGTSPPPQGDGGTDDADAGMPPEAQDGGDGPDQPNDGPRFFPFGHTVELIDWSSAPGTEPICAEPVQPL